MGLPCKHEIQTLLFAEEALKRDHLHSHWWLNPLAETQTVDPVTVVQNPIRVRRRGRPSEASTRRDLSQWELALNQISQREQRVEMEEESPSQSASQPARRRGGRERRQRGGSQRGGSQRGGSQRGGSQRAHQPPPSSAPLSALPDVSTDLVEVWNVID